MPLTLQDAWEKLRWARKHFDLLRPQVEAVESGDAYRVALDIDAHTGTYIFRIHDLEPLDPDWGLMIGDCLHNARTALDYLMVRLVALHTGRDPREIGSVQFPIYSGPSGDNDFAKKTAPLHKKLGFRGYLTRIEELQPFNLDNRSVWGTNEVGLPVGPAVPSALERLCRLDNLDKHRLIHAVWIDEPIASRHYQRIEFPEGFTIINESRSEEPLKNDAEIGRWQFQTPLPHEWRPSDMDVKRHFPVEVSFDEPSIFKGISEVIPLCLWGTEAVLHLFDPVFTSKAPPLPVTATLGWQHRTQ